MFDVLDRFWRSSISHVASHISFFAGLSMLIPILGQSWAEGSKPWAAYAGPFWIAIALIILGGVIIWWAHQSFSKLFKTMGWMMLIPGVAALSFSFFAPESLYELGRSSITGFATAEPIVGWLIHHNVPTTMNVASIYIVIGAAFIWVGGKIWRMQDYL